MKKIIFALFFLFFASGCVAGDCTPERNRLHNVGREGACQRNPALCIRGTDIAW